jgi:hypothetical protein
LGRTHRRGRTASLALATLSLAVTLAVGGTASVSAATTKKPVAVPGELIVGFREGVSHGQANAALAQAGAAKKHEFEQIDAALVHVPADRGAAIEKALSSDPRVRYVEPNHVVSIAAVPNDPSFNQLWGLHNTGQTGGTVDADIDATEAWDVETGSAGVVVAVTDTGVDFGHPDLAGRQWLNPLDPANGADDDGNGLVDDFRGWDFVSDDNDPVDDHDHGTHVSGTIGAVGDNGVGVTGVNWDVRIMALKFLDATGNGNTADAIAATLYAADHGADVSSNSWGGGPFDQGLLDAIEYGGSKGMLFVAAAGNDGANNDATATYPANYASEAIVSVAATDDDDQLAFFSNYGARTVDLAGPGVNVLSTTRGGTYQSFSGTSMATPHVSGVAALATARFPGATPYTLKALLLGSVDAKASLAGRTATGGRLNAANAVNCADVPEVVLEDPVPGFKASLGEPFEISVIGANCAAPAGLGAASVAINGAPVTLSAENPDTGLYSATFTPTVEGPLTVTASVTVGGNTAQQTVSGTGARNYACSEITDTWVDVTPGTRLTTASNSDDGFSALNITFPFGFYGQTYTTAYVSSNGFLTLGSSAGADAFGNVTIPTAGAPNGLVAPFWDDLDPATAGDVYAGLSGSPGSRALHVEWFNVPHFSLFGGSGQATFEVSLYEATGEVRYRYLDTDLGSATWNAGASATSGLEKVDGSFGKEISFNQAVLTSGKAFSCSFNTAPPPPPPSPTIQTTSLDDATTGAAYSEALTATGGTPPYGWSVAGGSLPPGLALDPTTGALTGTPTVAGAFSFTAQVTDSLSQPDTQSLSISVADPLAVTTTTLPAGTVGASYAQTLQATGGEAPYAWSVVAGSLPPGLALNGATIGGTPSTAGTYAFTVQASDAGSPVRTDTQALSIVIGGPTQVTASPFGTTVLIGTLRSGSVAGLASNDDANYEVDSTTSGKKTTAWYGSFSGVSNSLTSLRLSYAGKNSRTCAQVVSIWRWSTSSWVELDSRSVGTTEVLLPNLVPPGTLAIYVSGTTGDGEVRVQVRCRASGATFYTSGDLLQITYVRP